MCGAVKRKMLFFSFSSSLKIANILFNLNVFSEIFRRNKNSFSVVIFFLYKNSFIPERLQKHVNLPLYRENSLLHQVYTVITISKV